MAHDPAGANWINWGFDRSQGLKWKYQMAVPACMCQTLPVISISTSIFFDREDGLTLANRREPAAGNKTNLSLKYYFE